MKIKFTKPGLNDKVYAHIVTDVSDEVLVQFHLTYEDEADKYRRDLLHIAAQLEAIQPLLKVR